MKTIDDYDHFKDDVFFCLSDLIDSGIIKTKCIRTVK